MEIKTSIQTIFTPQTLIREQLTGLLNYFSLNHNDGKNIPTIIYIFAAFKEALMKKNGLIDFAQS